MSTHPETVYIVRHAAPEKGTGIRYDVPPGPPLSATGRAEAQRAAAYLADKAIARLICSPLDRARDTAGIIGQALRLIPLEDERLAEQRADESFEAVRARVQAFWAEQGQLDGPLAVVTHGSPARALLLTLADGALDLSRYNFEGSVLPTAGVWRAHRREEGWVCELTFQP